MKRVAFCLLGAISKDNKIDAGAFVKENSLYSSEEYIDYVKCRNSIFKNILITLEKLLYLLETTTILDNRNGKLKIKTKHVIANIKVFNSIFLIGLFPKIVCSNNIKYRDSIIKISKDFIEILTNNIYNKQNKLLKYIKLHSVIYKFYSVFKLL